jgi:uncharacterized membrane protein
MTNLFGLIVFVLFIIALVYLVVERIRLSNANKKALMQLIQSELDKNLLLTKLSDLMFEKDNKAIEQTDGFLKFVSESRDAAFQYIETVQSALKIFQKTVGKELNYFNTYGRAVDSPHIAILDKILVAYEELKKVMPEEDKEKNENQ